MRDPNAQDKKNPNNWRPGKRSSNLLFRSNLVILAAWLRGFEKMGLSSSWKLNYSLFSPAASWNPMVSAEITRPSPSGMFAPLQEEFPSRSQFTSHITNSPPSFVLISWYIQGRLPRPRRLAGSAEPCWLLKQGTLHVLVSQLHQVLHTQAGKGCSAFGRQTMSVWHLNIRFKCHHFGS